MSVCPVCEYYKVYNIFVHDHELCMNVCEYFCVVSVFFLFFILFAVLAVLGASSKCGGFGNFYLLII